MAVAERRVLVVRARIEVPKRLVSQRDVPVLAVDRRVARTWHRGRVQLASRQRWPRKGWREQSASRLARAQAIADHMLVIHPPVTTLVPEHPRD
eukprot:6052641-Prymnesium_polylepis.2